MFSKSFCLTICQFFYDVFPCQTFFYHQNHCMIQEIRDLIFDFFRIRILCCDHNFRCFFSNFFQDLINSLIKQIIRVRPLLWILFTVCDRVIYRFKDPKRIRLIIVNSYKRLEEAGRITGMACCSDLFYLRKHRISVTVDCKRFHILEMPGCLTFDPLAFSASAIVSHAPGFHSMLKCFLVHICHH